MSLLNPGSEFWNPQHLIDELEAAGLTPPPKLVRISEMLAALTDEAGRQNTTWGGRASEISMQAREKVLELPPAEAIAYLREAALDLAADAPFQQLFKECRRSLQSEARGIIRESADDLILQARPRFLNLVEKARPLVDTFGAGDIDPARVLAGSTDLRAAYDKLVPLRAELYAAAGIRALLAEAGYGDRGENVTWFLAEAKTDADLAQAEAVWNQPGHTLSNLIATRTPLTLNTVDDTEKLLAGIERPKSPIEPSTEQKEAEAERNRWRADKWRWASDVAGQPSSESDEGGRSDDAAAKARGQWDDLSFVTPDGQPLPPGSPLPTHPGTPAEADA